MDFSSITIQGNIISTGILGRIREDEEKYQSPSDFGLDRKDSVRDEIGVAWNAAKAHYTAFNIRTARIREGDSGTSETRNSWMIPLLRILGYDVERAVAYVHPDTQKSYAISHQAVNLDGFPIHIMGLNDDLDRRREVGGPRLGPHALVQEYLNNTEHTYALVTNGRYLRLLRDATRLVRLSYIEFNLEKMMEEELYADFALLFRVLHASRMPKSPDSVEESPIEYYHQESLASGTRIREKLSKAVENSILELANGFIAHSGNNDLHQSIDKGILKASDFYADLLQLIYRILFLIVIEERNLVYPETGGDEIQRFRRLYYDYYSIERLRRLAEKLHYVDGRKHDLWQGLKATFQLFENGFYGGKIGIKPLGSGIFSPAALREIPTLYLGNEELLKVIRLLTFFENDQQQQVRVNYSDLDVEEFGSVYEGLLEYDAEFRDVSGRKQFRFTKGTGRGETGAHYTPEELVKPLIRYSLDYIIEDKLKEHDREKALLSIRVCDVACGSGHILLSAARRIAVELSRVRTGEDQPSPTAMRHALRDVIRTCIYGVDKNPLAVNLCKVALWLEAHNPGEPLNFLDHHIKCGDAIVGLAHQDELFRGIADEAFKSLSGDDRQVASGLLKRNKAERKQREAETGSLGLQLMLDANQDVMKNMDRLLMQLRSFNNLPESTSEEIEAKAKAYRELQNGTALHHLKLLADLQVMQFFLQKVSEYREYLVTDKVYFGYLRGGQSLPYALEVQTIDQSLSHRFFHWFLEFPEVFASQKENQTASGFDVILGNPPYLVGKKISGNYGDEYLSWIKKRYAPANGSVDYVTYFFRRGFELLNNNGFISLITAKVIAQGDSRLAGLEYVINGGAQIIFAIKAMPWPGDASVEISLFSVEKKNEISRFYIGDRNVDFISSYLDDDNEFKEPYVLRRNSYMSFQGSVILGKGFILDKDEAQKIRSIYGYSDVLYPYLVGDDFNSHVEQKASREIINFKNYEKEFCEIHFPFLFKMIQNTVKVQRKDVKRTSYRNRWWQYAEKSIELYRAIKNKQRILVISQNSKPFAFGFVNPNQVFDQKMVVFAHDEFWVFSILQSSFHYIWAVKRGNTLGGVAITYTPTTVYQTYSFPQNLSQSKEQQLEQIGEIYHEHRKQLMLAMQLGLTKTYNLFHARQLRSIHSYEEQLDDKQFQKLMGKDAAALLKHLARTPDTFIFNEAVAGIQKLRDLHIQMDNAVLEAYGWSDIDLRHDFYEVEYLPENDRVRFTIHPDARREILKCLLELNHKIHAQEVEQGLWEKKGKEGKDGRKRDGQIEMNI